MLDQSNPAHIFTSLASLALTKYLFGVFARWKRSKSFEYVGQVSAVYCYPVKSCGGFQLEAGECSRLGVKVQEVTDRHWMVIKSNGDFLTQRQEPKMAVIQVNYNGNNLQIKADGMPVLNVPINLPLNKSKILPCRVWGDKTFGLDCGQEAGTWLSKFLGIDGLRLVFSAPELEKRDSSLVEKPWGKPALPGDQDNWQVIKIGETVEMRLLDPCTRCKMTTVNSSTGELSQSGEPLKTLKTFRCFDKYGTSPIFGVNATIDAAGPIHVGDPVYALRKLV
ncbi:mitochondrial amidoxime reducing component 2 isoform X2 [Patella vulgata]|uniref:mitochondrial amidoxime reducing component 2 isoform X2 n=1 Tax=Patella vulgata TaxID=6465 RepID=UPI00217F9E96|nr:mitochondrial amidoxime reducing component 2 isoform X2 [Patella vulgata]